MKSNKNNRVGPNPQGALRKVDPFDGPSPAFWVGNGKHCSAPALSEVERANPEQVHAWMPGTQIHHQKNNEPRWS
jgi:hypothetical protein